EASLAGDLCALGAAWGWALTAFIARRTVMREEGAEMQLFWMVLVSAPILLVASAFFGPLIRDLQPLHIVGLVFQSSVVVAGGFIAWLWLLSVYPSSTVASFSFLTPILALLLGWLLFGETLGLPILLAAVLVAAGIVLMNRPSASASPRGWPRNRPCALSPATPGGLTAAAKQALCLENPSLFTNCAKSVPKSVHNRPAAWLTFP
ncbi:MAG TPA: DMT family transporter, partial [Tabrizicola sp.]